MSEVLSRERTLELLSDYREGALEPRLHQAVEARLAEDAECREMLAALEELAELLPGLGAVPEPGAGLAGRAARAAWAAGPPAPVIAFQPPVRYRPAVPAQLQAAAAVAMLVTGLAALVSGPDAAPQQAASRLVERTSLELRQQSGRLVENIRELGERVGAAVETRLDQVGDRVDDYRRLLREEQPQAPASESRNGAERAPGRRHTFEPERARARTGPTSATNEARQHAAGHAPRRRA
jgi:anti-sigma factor RsiW